jgi:hypothetical protein
MWRNIVPGGDWIKFPIGIFIWHSVFFRFAAILQGVLKRAIDGNASSKKALDYGALAPKLADMAVKLI